LHLTLTLTEQILAEQTNNKILKRLYNLLKQL